MICIADPCVAAEARLWCLTPHPQSEDYWLGLLTFDQSDLLVETFLYFGVLMPLYPVAVGT
jgi:hypothetical protein